MSVLESVLEVQSKLITLGTKMPNSSLLLNDRLIQLDAKSINKLMKDTYEQLTKDFNDSIKEPRMVNTLRNNKTEISNEGIIKFFGQLVVEASKTNYCDASCLKQNNLLLMDDDTIVGVEGRHIVMNGKIVPWLATIIRYNLSAKSAIQSLIFQLTEYLDSVLKGNHLNVRVLMDRLDTMEENGVLGVSILKEALQTSIERSTPTLIYTKDSLPKSRIEDTKEYSYLKSVKMNKGMVKFNKNGDYEVNVSPYYISYESTDKLLISKEDINTMNLSSYKVFVEDKDLDRFIVLPKKKYKVIDILESDTLKQDDIYNRLIIISKVSSILSYNDVRQSFNEIADRLPSTLDVRTYDRDFKVSGTITLDLNQSDLPQLTEEDRIKASEEIRKCPTTLVDDCILHSTANIGDKSRLYLLASGEFKGKKLP